jgi:hypothetical protein
MHKFEMIVLKSDKNLLLARAFGKSAASSNPLESRIEANLAIS